MHSIRSDSQGVAAHSSAAFEAVVVPLIADTYRVALRFARQPDEARDLTQEALLRALTGFRHFTPGTNARAWLRTIVHSVFITRYRQRQRQPQIVDHDIEHVSEEPRAGVGACIAPSEPRSSALEGIADPGIRQAFNRLPPAFRDAVRLVDLDELTYDEAAAELRCPLNTLKSRLFRGRRHLAAALRGDAPTSR